MKNKMIYALGAMMLVGVTSCDLTEKPSSFYEKDTYFVTEGKAQMAVVGIYDCVETKDYYGQKYHAVLWFGRYVHGTWNRFGRNPS